MVDKYRLRCSKSGCDKVAVINGLCTGHNNEADTGVYTGKRSTIHGERWGISLEGLPGRNEPNMSAKLTAIYRQGGEKGRRAKQVLETYEGSWAWHAKQLRLVAEGGEDEYQAAAKLEKWRAAKRVDWSAIALAMAEAWIQGTIACALHVLLALTLYSVSFVCAHVRLHVVQLHVHQLIRVILIQAESKRW